MPSMYQNSTMLLFCLLNEANNSIDDILVDDILDIGLGPIESKEAHSSNSSVILWLPTCAIDYVGNLIQGQPFYVLRRVKNTWAIISSPMKMQSLTFVGIEISYWAPLDSIWCCIEFNFQLLYYKK